MHSYTAQARAIEQAAEKLDTFRNALFSTEVAGVSAKELYLSSNPLQAAPDLQALFKQFPLNRPETTRFVRLLGYYHGYVKGFRQQVSTFWEQRLSLAGRPVTLVSELRQALLQTLPAFIAETEKAGGLPFAKRLLNARTKLTELCTLWREPGVYEAALNLPRTAFSTESMLQGLQQARPHALECLSGPGPEWSAKPEDVESLLQAAQAAAETEQGNIFSKLLAAQGPRKAVRPYLDYNNLKPAQTAVLVHMLQNRLHYEALPAVRLFPDFPARPRRVADLETWFNLKEKALQAALLQAMLKIPVKLLNIQSLNAAQALKRAEALLKAAEALTDTEAGLLQLFTYEQLKTMATAGFNAEAEAAYLSEHFDNLAAFDTLVAGFSNPEKAALNLMQPFVEAETAAEFTASFTNGLQAAWLTYLEQEQPALRAAGNREMQHWQSDLQEAVLAKRALSGQMLLMRLRERTYSGLEYNRLQNRITYRDLLHQVTKKKRVWPLRRLMETHSEEVFKLVPCWMAGPESVSALFPMEKLFDLVIFDEASQCYAEKGIPALYRGRQVLIAGDDKQLQPSNLYQTRFDDTENESLEAEAESLLKLAEQYLPGTLLRGHYRSRKPELIEFSNRHFYGGKLRILPAFSDFNRPEPAITYIKTEGFWEQNRNQAEAQAVLGLVRNLQTDPETAGKSVGVVTFNAPQQYLIIETLEQAGIAANHPADPGGEPLFVKNLENVQGDERDIIIFSFAYAPEAPKGKNPLPFLGISAETAPAFTFESVNEQQQAAQSPAAAAKIAARFGSLNMPGGENRLNVAVTRAREKVYVVCSIFPQQLNTEGSLHQGPKLLKKYLEYALSVSEGRADTNLDSGNTEVAANAASMFPQLKYLLPANNSFLQTMLPYADLTVTHNGIARALLLTDDETYRSGTSVKEAHAYTLFALAAKDWPFMRVYSREFWLHRSRLHEKITAFQEKNKPPCF